MEITIKYGIEVVLCLCVIIEYIFRLKHIERKPTKLEYVISLITAIALFWCGFKINN